MGKGVKSPRWLINSCLYCSGPPTDELFRPLRRNFRKFFVRASCGRVEPCIRKVGGGGASSGRAGTVSSLLARTTLLWSELYNFISKTLITFDQTRCTLRVQVRGWASAM